MAIKMAKIEIQRIPWLMDNTKTWYLAIKPEVGGIPAMDISKMVIKTAIQGLVLNSPLKMKSSSCRSEARFINMKIINTANELLQLINEL